MSSVEIPLLSLYSCVSFCSLIMLLQEKERYTHLKAEFQRIARRDKTAFLSEQCKEIEGNNRMGKTRDLIKKIRDIKGTFHPKMGSKGQKWYGPNISKRCEEEVARIHSTIQRKVLMTWITMMV